MNTTRNSHEADPFAGFLASIALALLASNMLAAYATDLILLLFSLADPDIWKTNIAAGFFVGVVLADPVGFLIHKRPVKMALAKLLFGFFLGIAVQITFVMPLAGEAMSRFVFLILATLLLPVLFVIESYKDYLNARGISFGEVVAKQSLRVMNLPDRLLIVVTMAASFFAFWQYGNDVETAMIVIGSVLAVTTLFVAFFKTEPEPEEDWAIAAIEPSETASPEKRAIERAKELIVNVLPGAIILGGIMRIAVDVLLHVYPDVTLNTADPAEMAQTFGVVSAIGLGVVVFGMLAVLGFSLVSVLLIGRVGNWTTFRIRARCLQLIDVFCFRKTGSGH